jgi:hypothetical protein
MMIRATKYQRVCWNSPLLHYSILRLSSESEMVLENGLSFPSSFILLALSGADDLGLEERWQKADTYAFELRVP